VQPTDIILKKRRGMALSTEEIAAFVRGATDGSFADYQLSALLMAICLNGMDDRETMDLTEAMARSGQMADLSSIPGPKADKHSTGGVGDTTTLITAPLVAACGVKVAKMSGRGLGFTGGTLDKLESIPGLSIDRTVNQFVNQVRRIGLAVVGQSHDLAPADKLLYELRDVTATVDSLPLITSSILSKKFAAGCDVVALDVKTGSGALMNTVEKSVELAEMMVRVARLTGRRYFALVTDMDQPLGMYVGNALEVEEAIRALRGEIGGALLTVSLALGAQMLLGAGMAKSREEAAGQLTEALRSGAGLRKLAEMIEAQGGDPRVVHDLNLLPHAPERIPLIAEKSGYIAEMRTADIGYAALALGAGRERKEEEPDLSVGLIMRKRLGEWVERGEEICTLHAGVRSDIPHASELMRGVITLSENPPERKPLIYAIVGDEVEWVNQYA